jgi:sterol 3beta-glucosyltransferase
MKITILAIGTLGDVQPFLALGIGLKAAGHQIRIVTYATFETLVRQSGLEFSLVQFDIQSALQGEAGQATMESSDNPVRAFRNFARVIGPVMRQTGEDFWTACQDAEAIICASFGCHFGPNIARKLKIPCLDAFLQPVHPTRAFANFLSPLAFHQHKLGGLFNRLTHLAGDAILWFPYRSVINQWCQEQLNLPAIRFKQFRRQQLPAICGFSTHVVPKPTDWDDNIDITGYWFLNEGAHWQPPPKLLNFLESGTLPIFVGFGSMSTRDATEMTSGVLKALEQTGQRGLLSAGWGGLQQADLPNNILKIDYVPYSWLFPRTMAVVHHGGAGTTGLGLQAGVPSIIVPFMMDQPFWGQRVADLGVGPPPILRKQFSAEQLAHAIDAVVNDQKMRNQAIELGKRLQAENGIQRAVEVIHRRFLLR